MSWLNNLSSSIVPQKPIPFEEAVLGYLNQGTKICNWLGPVQIDAFERWCLGLGLFMERGNDRPDKLNKRTQPRVLMTGASAPGNHPAACRVIPLGNDMAREEMRFANPQRQQNATFQMLRFDAVCFSGTSIIQAFQIAHLRRQEAAN